MAAEKIADRCKFSTYGYACGKPVEHGRYLCEDHAASKCSSCGKPATHGCDYCGQFVCGAPLCDECAYGTDQTKPSGSWGFINHIHVSKPEFADKHELDRLKARVAEMEAALARLERYAALKSMDRLIEDDGRIVGWEKTREFSNLLEDVRTILAPRPSHPAGEANG